MGHILNCNMENKDKDNLIGHFGIYCVDDYKHLEIITRFKSNTKQRVIQTANLNISMPMMFIAIRM